MLKDITIKLIIYTVKAEKHHNNWKLDIKIIINEIKTLDMLTISNNKEFIILFNKLTSTVLNIKQMHKDTIY